MEVLIGSGALLKYDLNRSTPKDLDYWTDVDPKGCKGEDWKQHPKDLLDLIPTVKGVATPDAVYTIKCSHLGWDVYWGKTKADILWLKSNGCKLIPQLYNKLVERWKEVHGDKGFLSLNQSKEQFFTDKVDYTFDHDYLHELCAYPNRPIYEQVLKKGESVAIDKVKFDQLDFEQQVRMFREEITVIACERWLLNKYWKGKVYWYQAYMWSLKKTITNLTKGWATDFIVLNLDHFIKPDFKYFEYLLTTLREENIMSKVDLSVFEELLAASKDCEQLDSIVYHLCEGDFGEVGLVSYSECGSDCQLYDNKCKAVESEWGYEHLTQEGGGEGGGEYCYGVFNLKGKVYRAEYRYYSYHGCEIDGIVNTLREVSPVQKMVTVYE